jgi:hypothetical protein
MLRPLGKAASILVLVCIANGHWGIIQGVAWFNMLKDRAPNAESLSQLVADTVVGTAPCHLCVAVAKNTQHDKDDPDSPSQSVRISPLCPVAIYPVVLTPPRPYDRIADPDIFPGSRSEPPPVQPPRSFA